MSSDQCDEDDPPPQEPPVELPCIPTWDGETFTCEGSQWGYLINVRAAVPPARVQVRPFPRWIVGMGCLTGTPFQSGQPGSLTLQDYPRYTPPELCAPNGPGFSAGCWSNTVDFPQRAPGAQPQAGDIRNYQIGLRWRRVRSDQPHANDIGAVPPVCWDFDERAWNIGQNFGCGPVPAGECGSTMVTHVYETSSWGKPTNGPNFVSLPCGNTPYCCEQVPAVWDNPAYQVRVYTTWAIEWKTTWEQYEVVDVEWEESCRCEGWDYSGRPDWERCEETPPDSCTGPNHYWLRHGTPIYEWVRHESPGGYQGWHAIDLSRFPNQATWYYLSYAVITTGAGAWCNYEYADPDPGDTVRVPVIEVQSVLVDDCWLYGTCPEAPGGGGPTPPPQGPPPTLPPPVEPTPCPPGVCP